jgi:hypothetical protein
MFPGKVNAGLHIAQRLALGLDESQSRQQARAVGQLDAEARPGVQLFYFG